MKILCFNSADKLSEIKVTKNTNIIELIGRTDKRNIKNVYIWSHDNIILECYGCDTDEGAEKINSHCLPPSESAYNLYGDIYLVSKLNGNIINLDISQYGMLSYCIQERYENLDVCDYVETANSEEETDDEIDDIETPPKINNVDQNTDSPKIIAADELDYDTTNY